MVRLQSATTRVDKLQTSPLTSRLSETSTGAGLSRHDDVERTSLMLAIVATMCGLDICDVSHHRCASVGFGWHRRDDLSIPRCVDHHKMAHVEAQGGLGRKDGNW